MGVWGAAREQPDSSQWAARQQPGSYHVAAREKPGINMEQTCIHGSHGAAMEQPGSSHIAAWGQPGGSQGAAREWPGSSHGAAREQPGSSQGAAREQPGRQPASQASKPAQSPDPMDRWIDDSSQLGSSNAFFKGSMPFLLRWKTSAMRPKTLVTSDLEIHPSQPSQRSQPMNRWPDTSMIAASWNRAKFLLRTASCFYCESRNRWVDDSSQLQSSEAFFRGNIPFILRWQTFAMGWKMSISSDLEIYPSQPSRPASPAARSDESMNRWIDESMMAASWNRVQLSLGATFPFYCDGKRQ